MSTSKKHVLLIAVVVILGISSATGAGKYGQRCPNLHVLECERFMKCINTLCLCDDSIAKFLNGRCVSKDACDSIKDCDDRTFCFSGECTRINLSQIVFVIGFSVSFALLAFGINYEIRRQKRRLRRAREATVMNGRAINGPETHLVMPQ